MINFELKRSVTTTQRVTARITGKDLVDLINRELVANGTPETDIIPKDAEVFVRVPGGADWSNEDLDIDNHPIQVQWTRTTTEGSL